MSDWFRSNDDGTVVEVRYLDIPDLPPGEIDEIVCGPVHLETLDTRHAYLRVAGLMVNIWARDGWLSITCEPDDCTPITHEVEYEQRAAAAEGRPGEHKFRPACTGNHPCYCTAYVNGERCMAGRESRVHHEAADQQQPHSTRCARSGQAGDAAP